MKTEVFEGKIERDPYGIWSDVDRGVYIGGECLAFDCGTTLFDKFQGRTVRVTIEVLPEPKEAECSPSP